MPFVLNAKMNLRLKLNKNNQRIGVKIYKFVEDILLTFSLKNDNIILLSFVIDFCD